MKQNHRVLDPNASNVTTTTLCALAIMTKAPRAGEVKTRLVPPLTPDEAAQLNSCFLRDIAAAISKTEGGRGIAVYTPPGAEADYSDILPRDFNLLLQRGGGFDERLLNAAADLFRLGFPSVCLINSDSPTVPAENFTRAAHLLSVAGDRIVLGPSEDGGYYLIGLKQIHPRLFEDIDWSTERVFNQTMDRAAELNLPVELLPAGYDVDDRATLRRLCDELIGVDARSKDNLAAATRAFLSNIVAHEGRARICP